MLRCHLHKDEITRPLKGKNESKIERTEESAFFWCNTWGNYVDD